jgi:hypothetical protein
VLAGSVGSDGAVVLDLVFRDEAYTGDPGRGGSPPVPERRYPPCLSGGGNEECVGG